VSKEEGREFFVLHCCYVDFDGNNFGHALHMQAVAEYQGSSTCADIGVYPLEAHPDKLSVVPRLVERGRKFEALTAVSYREYEGYATDFTERPPMRHYVRHWYLIPWDLADFCSTKIRGRIVIDTGTSIQISVCLRH
jgi:hypothetical protein